jgi:hypothetical protein
VAQRTPIYHDIPGAPFKIGERVRVVKAADGAFDQRCLGRAGEVQYFDYTCGCGQTYPGDPMIGVVFHSGSVEEFWKEELRAHRSPSRECP